VRQRWSARNGITGEITCTPRLSACHNALANHQIKLVVLHRWVELFFNCRIESMYLVDEEHITLLQVG